ncbi:DUF5995 family protein [Mycolicibacterium sp. XJ1819]
MTFEDVVTPAPVEPTWEPLAQPQTIEDVLRNLDQVLSWSVDARSTIGYFAVLYKRITVAIRDAVDEGVFDNGALIEDLDVVFARRYFDALNSYFYPDQYGGLTLPWEVAFVGDPQATILQHMMAGLNAHITFDLAPAVLAITDGSLEVFEDDFNRVNAVLGSQVPGILEVIVQRSPAVQWLRRLIPREIFFLKRVVKKLRKSAWWLAIDIAFHPDRMRPKLVNQASWTAAIGAWYLQPPARLTPFPWLVRAIARRENRDVAGNIIALLGVAETPAKMSTALLRACGGTPNQDRRQ